MLLSRKIEVGAPQNPISASSPQGVGKRCRKLIAGVKYAGDSTPGPKRWPGRPRENPENGL